MTLCLLQFERFVDVSKEEHPNSYLIGFLSRSWLQLANGVKLMVVWHCSLYSAFSMALVHPRTQVKPIFSPFADQHVSKKLNFTCTPLFRVLGQYFSKNKFIIMQYYTLLFIWSVLIHTQEEMERRGGWRNCTDVDVQAECGWSGDPSWARRPPEWGQR